MSQHKSKMEGIIDQALRAVMTVEEREEQRRSFAHGNVSMSNPDVTRAVIDKVADEMQHCEGCAQAKLNPNGAFRHRLGTIEHAESDAYKPVNELRTGWADN